MRISALDPVIVRWVMARADSFRADGRPWFGYARIAQNLRLRRKVILSAEAVKRLVVREDPALAWRRSRSSR